MVSPNFYDTHEVFNQSPVFEDVNLFTTDAVLQEAVKCEGAGGSLGQLEDFGKTAGSAEMLAAGRLANENPPRLQTYDLKGERLDIVEFHPAWHDVVRMSMAAGLHCRSWDHLADRVDTGAGRNVMRAAIIYMAYQMEPGHCCPLTMTNASVATIMRNKSLAKDWVPLILGREYDPALRPAKEKSAVTIGMGMTEKQGGTDVRANTTGAVPAGERANGGEYILTGHKWFMSAPMSDAFLMLAQAPEGLSCFFVPRILPDGRRNPLRFQGLKNKLGNVSNASAEVEFANVHGWIIGDEGRGIANILEMVTFTRLDCAVASAGLMRWGLANALHHADHRIVFQKMLIDQPLMRSVLADLCLDVEAAVALAFRLARAFDQMDNDEFEAAYMRILTPATKYWICKAAPGFSAEALECLGGNGYVESGPMARMFRESPLNSVWEGSGNVMCLDVLRAVQRFPDAVDQILSWLVRGGEGEPVIKAEVDRLKSIFAKAAQAEADFRFATELLVQLIAAKLLRENAPSAVADAFVQTRLSGRFRQTYGHMQGANVDEILGRARPQM